MKRFDVVSACVYILVDVFWVGHKYMRGYVCVGIVEA